MIFCLTVTTGVYGQKLSDLFGQHAKEIKNLKDQIAELLLFKRTLEKGYEIAHNGTANIYLIKQRDFGLHQDHFDSLRVVKPAIAQDGKVAAIREWIADTRDAVTQIATLSMASKDVAPIQYAYATSFCTSAMMNCSIDSKELDELLADGVLAMSDQKRLQRLDALYEEVYRQFLAAVQLEGLLVTLRGRKH